jgi:hypothetical protein
MAGTAHAVQSDRHHRPTLNGPLRNECLTHGAGYGLPRRTDAALMQAATPDEFHLLTANDVCNVIWHVTAA